MLRSFGLFLLLATTSLAKRTTHLENEYTVTLDRVGHAEVDCLAADVVIKAQMRESMSNATGGVYNRVVDRDSHVQLNGWNRKLRTGPTPTDPTPRELAWCDEQCRCPRFEQCRMAAGGYCADTCQGCACSRRGLTETNVDLDAMLSEKLTIAFKQLASNLQTEHNKCLGDPTKLVATVFTY
jgi:hypothetical protein